MDLDPVPDIDTSRPHPAEKVLAIAPSMRIMMRQNRAFLGRAVRVPGG